MRKQGTLYPNYDVLAHQDEWDEHTKEIVTKRLGPFKFQLLTPWEQEMVKCLAGHLAYESRIEILTWIAAHLDQQLNSALGEGQRKPGLPPQRELILGGFKVLDDWAKGKFFKGFVSITGERQLEALQALEKGSLEGLDGWNGEKQRGFFKKLTSLVIEAYYSHPWVWSEIGYGGPAYPRGYVRVELGLTDPWEPKRSE